LLCLKNSFLLFSFNPFRIIIIKLYINVDFFVYTYMLACDGTPMCENFSFSTLFIAVCCVIGKQVVRVCRSHIFFIFRDWTVHRFLVRKRRMYRFQLLTMSWKSGALRILEGNSSKKGLSHPKTCRCAAYSWKTWKVS
jgi:hypothetical protein